MTENFVDEVNVLFVFFLIEIRDEKDLLGQPVHSLLVILLCLFVSSKGHFCKSALGKRQYWTCLWVGFLVNTRWAIKLSLTSGEKKKIIIKKSEVPWKWGGRIIKGKEMLSLVKSQDDPYGR